MSKENFSYQTVQWVYQDEKLSLYSAVNAPRRKIFIWCSECVKNKKLFRQGGECVKKSSSHRAVSVPRRKILSPHRAVSVPRRKMLSPDSTVSMLRIKTLTTQGSDCDQKKNALTRQCSEHAKNKNSHHTGQWLWPEETCSLQTVQWAC